MEVDWILFLINFGLGFSAAVALLNFPQTISKKEYEEFRQSIDNVLE